MKVYDLYAEYEYYTKALTESGYKLAYGAAAIAWFFRGADFTFPVIILFSILFVVLYFIVDILQKLISAIGLKQLARSKEAEIRKRNGNVDSEEVTKPVSFTRIPYLLFMLKFPFLLLAYVCMAIEFSLRLMGK